MLDAYHFTNMDEFDLVLLRGMQDGHFDAEGVERHAAELDKRAKVTNLDNSFAEAWRMFHNSFDNNEGEVLDATHVAFLKNIENISPINLSGTVILFKELDRTAQAAEIIKY